VVVAVDSEVAVLAEEDLEAVDPVVEEVLSDLEECDLLVDHSFFISPKKSLREAKTLGGLLSAMV
jgi:hypothetical protein